MTRLLVSQHLFDGSLDVFADSGIEIEQLDRTQPLPTDELAEALQGHDGLICLLTDRVDATVLERNPQLKVVANVAVGYDNIDVAAARQQGTVVTNTPDVLTETTADLTMALMLAVARRIPEADAFVRSGAWRRWELAPELLGRDLSGQTIGLVGMGRIGLAVARRAVHGFGMQLSYVGRRSLPPATEADLGAVRMSLDELVATSDVVSLHAPLTPETHHLLGEAELAAMQPHAILINTSRGPLVDERALVRALRAKALWGVGLDVFEAEPVVQLGLLEMRARVVLAPHLGSATEDTRRRMAAVAAANAHAVLTGARPPNPVDG